MVRSAWRRVKKDIKDAIIRDLKPVKDVKGGGGVTGESKPTTGSAGTTAGTAVTYTTANDVAQFNGIMQPTTKPYKPVGSPANDNAAAEIAKVKFTGTTGAVKIEVRAGQALTANTVYVWNIFLIR